MSKAVRGSLFVLIVLHIVGLIGIVSPFRDWVVALTPVNLLITAGLLFWNHESFSEKTIWVLLIAFFGGIGIEILGVATGTIFGEYAYGEVLGPKIAGAPFMIGVNWAILLFASAGLAKRFFKTRWKQLLFGASLMVLIDIFIEPIAITLDWWNWSAGVPGLLNYIAWFAVSLVMHAFYVSLIKDEKNPLAAPVYIIQFTFFLFLNLAL